MVFIAVFVFFASVFMLVYGILFTIYQTRLSIADRMEQITDIHNINQESSGEMSFLDRVIKPIYIAVSDFILKVTPSNKIALLTKKLEKAGMLKNSSAEKWIYTKTLITIIFSILFGVLVYAAVTNIIKAFIITLIMMFLINTIFNFYLASRIDTRKKMILKDLPYTLDLITVSVEAGLSFDGAMSRVVSNISGDICDEFAKSLKEIRMGIQRKAALKNMADRCEVKELSMLVTSIIQADELGVSLGKVLRIESANLREHRKQAAREKAMKAPIKMLFPLIFFIFPSIFIIILGPAVIKMIDIF